MCELCVAWFRGFRENLVLVVGCSFSPRGDACVFQPEESPKEEARKKKQSLVVKFDQKRRRRIPFIERATRRSRGFGAPQRKGLQSRSRLLCWAGRDAPPTESSFCVSNSFAVSSVQCRVVQTFSATDDETCVVVIKGVEHSWAECVN